MQGKVFSEGVHASEFPGYRMRELYRHSVALAVKDMADAGLDIVTDGGQHYEN
jgi:5-methyltetrahydropteroyltriglutamate--homocysteine methyltransferase